MRPRSLDEYIGQSHIVGPGKLLRRAIDSDRLSSVILYGPPGTGKTSLAHVIASTTQAKFDSLNAVEAGTADVRKALAAALNRLGSSGQRTIVFIDEIHRFNKAQQDLLLPEVERGVIRLIGATTQNPYFAVNAPLVSRSMIFELKSLTEEDLVRAMRSALSDERGLKSHPVTVTDADLLHLARLCEGDARKALNALEIAVLTTPQNHDSIILNREIFEDSIQRKAPLYDRDGDQHYDTISALIKSMRGSDPDAALYWLAKMLEAGEDIRFLSRRIVICAAEDVGMADPQALLVAAAAQQITEFVGMPEARIPLAEAVLYISTAPKSNTAITSIDAALAAVREKKIQAVPGHLKDAHYAGAEKLGAGKGYQYAHDYKDGVAPQNHMETPLEFYQPTGLGFEKKIQERLAVFKQRRVDAHKNS
ncbi:replication-associated recombination protein A [Kamptonema cortianum]|nr:replication-associated recombination protein A [Kamptonema cortianum]MDL5050048.1 replication-associated recombination protein A [Oscillatoria amoena NRMC-F 0135]